MIIGILLGAAIGALIDRKEIKTTPYFLFVFMFRGIGLISMTTLVTDFESQKGLLMVCFIAMTSGTFLETIVCQSLMNKRLIAPIKEICNGAG